mgnify:CR=1 FL=1
MELQDRLLSIEKEQEKMRASNRELEALALYDSMTNLANRTLLNEYVSRKFEEAKQAGKLYGVEILDIETICMCSCSPISSNQRLVTAQTL